jgi:hypothetical protein
MYLATKRKYRRSGKYLADCLEIPFLVEEDYERMVRQCGNTIIPHTVIRYGSTMQLVCNAEINKIEAIRKSSNKFTSLSIMKQAGIKVPKFSEDWEDLTFPMFARKKSHFGGSDIVLCLCEYDAKLAKSKGADFFVQWVNNIREYRYHVVGDKVLPMKKILPRETNVPHFYVKNFKLGWEFSTNCEVATKAKNASIKAVKAFGLDFGAVDLLHTEDDKWITLEVNTAPGLSEASIDFYVDNIKLLCNDVAPVGGE